MITAFNMRALYIWFSGLVEEGRQEFAKALTSKVIAIGYRWSDTNAGAKLQ